MVAMMLPMFAQGLMPMMMKGKGKGGDSGEVDPMMFLQMIPEPFDTASEMVNVSCPTLVLHGDMDEIVPVEQGVECYEKCASKQKVLKRWEEAGHIDIRQLFNQEWEKEVSALL